MSTWHGRCLDQTETNFTVWSHAMNAATPSSQASNLNPTPNVPSTPEDATGIPLYDRMVLWMFLLGFILFGVIILGDMLAGYFR
jgi:hypothetical protein